MDIYFAKVICLKVKRWTKTNENERKLSENKQNFLIVGAEFKQKMLKIVIFLW